MCEVIPVTLPPQRVTLHLFSIQSLPVEVVCYAFRSDSSEKRQSSRAFFKTRTFFFEGIDFQIQSSTFKCFKVYLGKSISEHKYFNVFWFFGECTDIFTRSAVERNTLQSSCKIKKKALKHSISTTKNVVLINLIYSASETKSCLTRQKSGIFQGELNSRRRIRSFGW